MESLFWVMNKRDKAIWRSSLVPYESHVWIFIYEGGNNRGGGSSFKGKSEGLCVSPMLKSLYGIFERLLGHDVRLARRGALQGADPDLRRHAETLRPRLQPSFRRIRSSRCFLVPHR